MTVRDIPPGWARVLESVVLLVALALLIHGLDGGHLSGMAPDREDVAGGVLGGGALVARLVMKLLTKGDA